jgi:glycosyltransferase involved in cell wall biosynthesis
VRILFVHDYGVLAGGAERITVELRDGMRRRGHDARFFASTASDFPLPNQADDTCFGTNAWPRPFLQVHNPAAVRKLGRVLRDFRPDVVHVRMFLTQLSPGILPLLRGTPALLHVGGYHSICPLGTRQLPDESRCTYRAGIACRRQGCVSTAGMARTILQLGRWRRHRDVFGMIVANNHALARALSENDVAVSTVVWNGAPVVPPRPTLAGPPLVAYAGRLVPRKGVDLLLRAMSSVVDAVPAARLVIAGDGSDRSRLERLVAALSLRDSVSLSGHLDRADLDRLLAPAWVQVVPSRYPEPFANAGVEAMMRGTALVVSDIGGLPEVVRDGVTGFVVPVGRHEVLAERLTAILSDRALAERLGAAARGVALEHLTLDRMLDRFEEMYVRLMEVRGPRSEVRKP